MGGWLGGRVGGWVMLVSWRAGWLAGWVMLVGRVGGWPGGWVGGWPAGWVGGEVKEEVWRVGRGALVRRGAAL